MISAIIVGAETVADGSGPPYTLYAIAVSSKLNGDTWTVYRRFSWFLQLDRQLPVQRLPRSWLDSGTAATVVETRKTQLNEYLQQLLLLPIEISLSEPVREFLRIIDTPPTLDDGIETPPPSRQVSATPPPMEEDIHVRSDLTRLEDYECAVKQNSNDEKSLISVVNNLLVGIGESTYHNTPTVAAVEKLLMLRRLVSVETNLDCGHVVKALRSADWRPARLGWHIRNPTSALSRSAVFHCVKASGLPPSLPLGGDDYAISQYAAWLQHQAAHGEGSGGVTAPSAAALAHTGLSGVFALGPASPTARSIGPSSPGGRTNTVSSIACDAREWVMFSNAREFIIPGTTAADDSGWIDVPVPDETKSHEHGLVTLKYKPAPCGECQVSLQWTFPGSTDMESLVNLVWDPVAYLESIGAPPDFKRMAECYFGILRFQAPTDAPASSAHPHPMSGVSQAGFGASNSMVRAVSCVFPDPRRVGGTAVANVIKSCGKSASANVVIACSADPRIPATATTDPLVRPIKHLHIVGCEIDVNRGVLTGTAMLSAESVFLVANDLLGERMALWKAVENVSTILRSVSHATAPTTSVSYWLTHGIPIR